jgi:hypothetical protein
MMRPPPPSFVARARCLEMLGPCGNGSASFAYLVVSNFTLLSPAVAISVDLLVHGRKQTCQHTRQGNNVMLQPAALFAPSPLNSPRVHQCRQTSRRPNMHRRCREVLTEMHRMRTYDTCIIWLRLNSCIAR